MSEHLVFDRSEPCVSLATREDFSRLLLATNCRITKETRDRQEQNA